MAHADLSDWANYTHTQELVCPHCGYIEHDTYDYDDEDGDASCNDCGEDFRYSRHVEVTFTTSKPDAARAATGGEG